MKPKFALRHFLALAGSSILAVSSASAATGIWTQTGAGPFDWSTTTNWSGGTIADGADFTASFSSNITANQTINLDAARTIGNIVAADGSNDFIISGGNILTLDRTSGIPVINVTPSGRALTISSVIAGLDGLDKWGAGQLNLNGSAVNTFTGGVKVSNGTLNLDFANLVTPTNLVNSANTLTLGGGTLLITGNSTTDTNQTLGNVTVNAGGGRILVNPNGASRTATLTLGSITPAATGTLLVGKSSGSSGTATITTTSGTLTNGIYGGNMVYFNGTANTGYDWATTSGGGPTYTISGLAGGSYTTLPTSGGVSTTNYQMTASTTLTGGFSVNTLKMAPGATGSVALNLGSNTLTVEGGGILFTGTGATNRINTGTVTAGAGSGYKLFIHNYNSNSTNNVPGIDAAIADNGANAVAVVVTSTGFISLSNTSNSFTGGLYLNNGSVQLSAASTVGSHNNNTIYANGYSSIIHAGTTTTSAIQLSDGAVLDLRGNTSTFTTSGAVTGNGGITLGQAGGGSTTLNFNSTTNTFTGPIRYAVTAGGGTLTVNSLADATSFGAGDITFGDSNSTVAHNFTYGTSAIAPLTLNNRRFELTGSGTQTSSINNNSSQAFTINTNLLSTATGTKTLSLGGTGTGLGTFAGTITNGALTTLNLTKAGAGGTWVLTNTANTYNGTTAVTGGTLGFVSGVLGSGGTINASGGTLLWLPGNTEDISSRLAMTAATNSTFDTYNNNVTFASAFGSSTTGRLVKTGLGALTLQGNNTFTGTTTISGGGTLVLDYSTNNGSKIGNAALNLSGGNLVLRGNSLVPQAVTSIVIAANTGNSISRDSSTTTIANAGVLTMGANSNLSIAEAGIVSTTTANVSGIQTLGLVTVGSHFATRDSGGLLQAYGAYNPVTTAGGGVNTVVNQLSGGGTMGAVLNSYSLRIVNDANDNILDLGTNRNLSLANGGTLLYAGGFNDNYTINGTSTAAVRAGSGNQNTNVNVFAGTLTINAILGSNANSPVSKTGAGTLVVGGANSARSGAASTTFVQQGVFRLANDFGLGDATGGTIVQNGAALELSQPTALTPADITVGAEALSITGTGISNGGALRNHTGSNTYGGLITIGAGGARINANAATSLALTGGIVTSLFNDVTFGGAGNISHTTTAISGAGGLIKDGAGTLTLSASNTYTGNTTISAGTMEIGGSGTLGNVSAGLGNYTGNISIDSTSSGKLVYKSSATQTLGGVVSGAGALTVENGTLILNNINTYTGATTVTAGTLAVASTGTINSTTGITIASGATFAYNSTTALTAVITNNGGRISGTGAINVAVAMDSTSDVISPGNSPGIQPYGASQTWSGLTYEWEVNDFIATTAGADFDQIAITGNLALTGAVSGSYILDIISLTGGDVAGNVPNFAETSRTWNILTTTGTISGFNDAYWTLDTSTGLNTFTSSPAWTGTWSLDLNATNNALVLSYTAIPEPGAALLGSLGVLLLFRRRR